MKPTLTSYTVEKQLYQADDTFSAQKEKLSFYTAVVGVPLKKKKSQIEHETVFNGHDELNAFKCY